MPKPSHSTPARSRSVFEPDLPAINSSRTHTEQRHTAANTPYPPKRCQVVVCPGPSASWRAQFRRTHGYGGHECDGDSRFSPYGRDVPRHVSHGFENPEPIFHQHHQHSEADPLGASQHGRLLHRPSSYDAADRELEFDQRGRSGHYSPPQYDSASDDSFDAAHGSHRNNGSPFEPQSLLSFFGMSFDPSGPDSRSQDPENRDTNLDRSRWSRSLGGGNMGPPLGSFPDCIDLESFQHDERGSMGPPLVDYSDYADLRPRKDHERDGRGPPLANYPDYADLERCKIFGRGSMEPSLESHPDYADFESLKDYDPRRAGVRRAGRHLTRHRLEDDFEADDLEDNLNEAFIHRPHLARPRGHHLDPDVGSIDTDSEEEYFKNIRDFDLVDDTIVDRYTGGLRAPTAAEKTHRRYLVSLSKDFDREYLRAERGRAELWLLKRHDPYAAQSDTENDSFLDRVARRIRHMDLPGIRQTAAGFSTGNRKLSPRGRHDDQISDSESITPQPQNSHPQVRHQTAAQPTTTNNSSPPHETHNNPPQPRRAPVRPTRPQNPHPNTTTALPKDQAPPSYDSVPPAQVTDNLQPDPTNHTPRSPLPTAATESTTPNTAKATPRSNGENLLLKNQTRGTLLESIQGQPKQQINLMEYSSPPAVRASLVNDVHTSPAGLGGNDKTDSSDSGAATPMTSNDDSDVWLDSE